MNIKRAVMVGALIWVLIFFEVCILMFGLKMQAGTAYYTTHYILAAVIVALCSLIYFRGKNVKKGASEGFQAGLVMLITGIILDSVITVPLWIMPGGGSYASFFLDPYMIVGLVETVVVVTIIGALKK